MSHATTCPPGHWCSRADALLNLDGIHITAVDHAASDVRVHVETDQTLMGCPACGVVAVGHGRRRVVLASSASTWRLGARYCLAVADRWTGSYNHEYHRGSIMGLANRQHGQSQENLWSGPVSYVDTITT